MNIDFFADPGLVPKPRGEIRIEAMHVTPYGDGRRVRVEIELTPFAPSDRPSIELVARAGSGVEVASLSIVEAVHRQFGVTMHLQEAETPQGEYQFQADLYYPEEPVQHTVTTQIKLPDDNTSQGANM